VPHLLHDNHRGFLIEHLVDRDHGAEFHQHFDHLGGLDRHLLREIGYGNGLWNQHFMHNRISGQRKCVLAGIGVRPRLLAVTIFSRVPTPRRAVDATSLDRAALRALVAPAGILSRFLRGFTLRALGSLRRRFVQSAGWGRDFRVGFRRCVRQSGRRRFRGRRLFRRRRFDRLRLCCRCSLSSLLLRFLALLLTLGLNRRLGGLAGDQLRLLARLFLANFGLFDVDRRGRRGWDDLSWSRRRRLAFDQHSLLAHLDLDSARFAGAIGLFDLAGLSTSERDLVLALFGPVHTAQILEQLRLVLFRERRIVHQLLAYAGGL
jgi:hypothetical protein